MTPFLCFNALAGIFCFLALWVLNGFLAVLYLFQCPRGHFLFSGLEALERGVRAAFQGFNALAGIFCFLALSHPVGFTARQIAFQCPRGHFLFSGNGK